MREALAAEAVKLRRSRLPWITAIGFTLATVVSGLFTFIAQDPGRAGPSAWPEPRPRWPG